MASARGDTLIDFRAMCCHVRTQSRQMDGEGHTIAGKSNIDFHHYLFSLRVLIPTAVAQEQLVSFLSIDLI